MNATGIGILNSLMISLAALCAILAVLAPPAAAEPDDPLTPELSVPSNPFLENPFFPLQFPVAYPDRTAGAHPDLVIGMQKPFNQCPVLGDQNCTDEEIYIEQDLKKMVTHLPSGLVADANAAPYCEPYQEWAPDLINMPQHLPLWFCDPDSVVGAVEVDAQACTRYPNLQWDENASCLPPSFDPQEYTILLRDFPGAVYNARPRTEGPYAGEQGHLIALVPSAPFMPEDEFGGYVFAGWIRSDISIRVRDGDNGDLGIDAVADMIPDLVDLPTENPDGSPGLLFDIPVQIARLDMALYGDTGAGNGHPLLTNPTFCDPQAIDVLFQGYERNSYDPPFNEGVDPDVETPYKPGSGEGKVVTDSAPYQVTGCDSVPYDPNLSINLDNTGPEAVPAISSTMTQDPDEATTDGVEVKFPSSFKINAENTAEHCSEEDLAAETCPLSSRIGTVTAESRLLPEQGPMAGPLTGNVYLAGLTADSVKMSAFLTGFIDLRIDAEGKVEDDLTITTTFADLPAVPISKFDLNLEGGDKGVLKNPKVCGSETITADFTSHSKKVKRNTVPVEIKGCTDPVLDVELSNRRKGELTDLDLSISSPGTAIAAAELRLARHLKWGKRKRLSPRVAKRVKGKRIKRLKSAGTATFLTAEGERKVRIKAKRTKYGNLGFSPLKRRTKEGQIVAAQVPGFSASLFRTARRQPAATGAGGASGARKGKTGRKRAKHRKSRRQTDLTLTGLPGEDLTTVELDLRGKDKRRKFFIRNPIGCKKALNFVAIVTTTDGRKLALKDQVRLRGKGCGKKKKKK